MIIGPIFLIIGIALLALWIERGMDYSEKVEDHKFDGVITNPECPPPNYDPDIRRYVVLYEDIDGQNATKEIEAYNYTDAMFRFLRNNPEIDQDMIHRIV